MHDSLGQSLSIIVNRADLLLSKPQDEERTAAHVGEIAITAHDEQVGSGDLDTMLAVCSRVGALGKILRENPELRTAALETVLIEKGLASTDAIDSVIEAFQNEIGPRNGARMIARAWVDPAYRRRLLADGGRGLMRRARAFPRSNLNHGNDSGGRGAISSSG